MTCKVHHHYERVMDDNPEQRGGSYLKCTKCGHIKEDDGGHGGTVVARWGVEKIRLAQRRNTWDRATVLGRRE